MPITLSPAPTPWPAAVAAAPAVIYGRPVTIEQGEGGRIAALRWDLQRNCSIAPAQLLAVYLSLCLVSLLIGSAFFFQGAQPVLMFAGAELLALGAALLVYARHASDHETLTLAGHRLQVEVQDGNRASRTEFRAEWLAVEPSAGQGSLVELSGEGRRLRVGRFLRPELRAAFANELRRALRRACLVLPPSDTRIEAEHPR